MLFVTSWMELESIMLNEICQTEKRKILYDIICVWNLKKVELGEAETRTSYQLPDAGWWREKHGNQRVQTSPYMMNKFRDLTCSMVILFNTVYA